MAYRTYHMLTILGADPYEDVYSKGIEIFGKNSDFHYAICEEESDFCNESRWDTQEGDMRLLSTYFPDSVLAVYGEGEANEDLWHAYYKNGKMQYSPATITYDEYDESKLV